MTLRNIAALLHCARLAPASRSWPSILGAIVSITTVVAVIIAVYEEKEQIIEITTQFRWAKIFSAVIFYSLNYSLLALAWNLLLGEVRYSTTTGSVIGIFALTQITKYFPGNVFHFVGRVLLTKKLGFQTSELVSAMFAEQALLILAAFSILMLLLPGLTEVTGYAGTTLGLVVSVSLSIVVLYTLLRKAPLRSTSILVICFLQFMVFFGLTGICGFYIINVGLSETLSLRTFIFTFTMGWLAGFMTPGAPGGAGIREVVIIKTLETFSSPTEVAVTVALMFRLITLGGDILFFIPGYIWWSCSGRHLLQEARS